MLGEYPQQPSLPYPILPQLLLKLGDEFWVGNFRHWIGTDPPGRIKVDLQAFVRARNRDEHQAPRSQRGICPATH